MRDCSRKEHETEQDEAEEDVLDDCAQIRVDFGMEAYHVRGCSEIEADGETGEEEGGEEVWVGVDDPRAVSDQALGERWAGAGDCATSTRRAAGGVVACRRDLE